MSRSYDGFPYGERARVVLRHSLPAGLAATAGLSSSAEGTVGQANRDTRQFNCVGLVVAFWKMHDHRLT